MTDSQFLTYQRDTLADLEKLRCGYCQGLGTLLSRTHAHSTTGGRYLSRETSRSCDECRGTGVRQTAVVP